MIKTRRELAGKQYIDVGIAEQNAVTMAVGMAKKEAVNPYLQRMVLLSKEHMTRLNRKCVSIRYRQR